MERARSSRTSWSFARASRSVELGGIRDPSRFLDHMGVGCCLILQSMRPLGEETLEGRSPAAPAQSRSTGVSFNPKQVAEGAPRRYGEGDPPHLVFNSSDRVLLYRGDCLALLSQVNDRYPEGAFDVIFADPPYFLSNGGITCHAGRMVSVDKGRWDKSQGVEADHEFHMLWLSACRDALKPNGTIWVSGTSHVIYSVGFAMQ